MGLLFLNNGAFLSPSTTQGGSASSDQQVAAEDVELLREFLWNCCFQTGNCVLPLLDALQCLATADEAKRKTRAASPAEGGTYFHVSDTSPIHDKYESFCCATASEENRVFVHSSFLCWKLQRNVTWPPAVPVAIDHRRRLRGSGAALAADQRSALAGKQRNKRGLHHMVCLGQRNFSLRALENCIES